MAEIDGQEVFNAALMAMRGVFDDRWPKVRAFAQAESKAFLANMAEIQKMKLEGEIDEDEAATLTRMHTRSMEAVLVAVEGVSIALAEQAVNAAIIAVRDQINKAIGWALL